MTPETLKAAMLDDDALVMASIMDELNAHIDSLHRILSAPVVAKAIADLFAAKAQDDATRQGATQEPLEVLLKAHPFDVTSAKIPFETRSHRLPGHQIC